MAIALAQEVTGVAADQAASTDSGSLLTFVTNSVYFQIGGLIVLGLVAIFTIAMAYWTFRDVRLRTQNRVVWVIAVLLVLFLNVVGLLFYALLRPQKTLEEREVEELERRLLEEEGEDLSEPTVCKKCKHRVPAGYRYCTHCGTETHPHCSVCKAALQSGWKHCPTCGTTVPEEKNDKSDKKKKDEK